MKINNQYNLNFCGVNIGKIAPYKSTRQSQYMQDSYAKMSSVLGKSVSDLALLLKDANSKNFSFLKTMVNKYNHRTFGNITDDSEHIMNIYSMVDKPIQAHFNILSRTTDSFDKIEKIFSLAKDEKSLDFVESLQFDILKNSDYQSQITIDLLSSKFRDKYINKIGDYTSYLKLHENNKEAVKKLDELIENGKYSKLKSDAQYAIQKLMKKKTIGVAMAGKTTDLEAAYTKERGNFLSFFVNNFLRTKSTPSNATQNIVLDMYNTVSAKNMQLRQDIMDRFKYNTVKDKTAEIKEMKILFETIDNNKEAGKFVHKAINRDLKVASIGELNEILGIVPIKKANVFFNNAKRIIETSEGQERRTALVKELENPFFKSSVKPTGKAKIIRMRSKYENESLLSKAFRYIENEIDKFIYNHMAA